MSDLRLLLNEYGICNNVNLYSVRRMIMDGLFFDQNVNGYFLNFSDSNRLAPSKH
ncbi:hypothetical protein NBRC116591_33440 [Sessilibacter corallicola]|uniref:Uncharacterized protein n=1 Tax=Sessilibacter corallicola TaxID=2904075 RepID=A0ABQ0ACZ9_9GAMM